MTLRTKAVHYDTKSLATSAKVEGDTLVVRIHFGPAFRPGGPEAEPAVQCDIVARLPLALIEEHLNHRAYRTALARLLDRMRLADLHHYQVRELLEEHGLPVEELLPFPDPSA